ncbi:hypothetical protein GCM10011363_39200 [Marivita lacus]|uniref:DUF4214 domain-containing protein n=1 Tax=Marivita lacus TaxID=1323742 RepID=A0ABQ1L2T0_9RHOB|nr:DUF4214 domain-containing protein [Marivita lacus]GGC18730.1 hypothetical protein GCM10011363_39200 [Marivita lacus]
MALDLSTLTTEQQLAAIYIGYYDRAADPVGEDFWEGAVANPNLSLADIATDFATQPETLIAYPFLSDPTAEEANAFITEVYLNLFNRAPDQAGLEFWSEALLAAIDGTGTLTVGEIILSIIEGAQDSEEGNDRATILNKIEVATTWTNAAEAADIDYTTDTAAQSSAQSIIEGVTDEQATVAAAKSTIDNFFEPAPVPGEEYLLTSATDVINGTSDDDEFNAYIQQNPFAGGVSNSLASADRLDGGAGNDRLYAEITNEFVGASSGVFNPGIDIQPRIKNIEELDFEARDYSSSFFGFGEVLTDGEDFSREEFDGPDVVIDAKNISGHNEIGSYFSDGDLTIENLTTLTKPVAEGGVARNTSDITITMDHTDNFNSDYDASDLTVLFDNDYLLSGQEAEGKVFYFLLDEDAELAGNPNRLNNIDVDGIRFTITNADGTETDVTIESSAANIAGTHQGFVNALQAPLQALIADGTLPAGTTLVLDPTITDFTFIDDGSQSDPIPAMVLTSGDGSQVTATGFSRIEEEIGEYDVYGRFESEFGIEDQPISIDIDLHKVGRGGDGGDLIIGGKAPSVQDGIAGGIEVFNINVLGAGNEDPNGGMTKPSSLGTIQSTLGALDVVNIATDPMFAQGETFASLEVREGFGGTLSLINADAFLGDLTLNGVVNADTITAQGGGDVTLGLNYNGSETDTAYSVTTGGGEDDINVSIDGDALDFANSSFSVSTGGGDDSVVVDMDVNEDGDDDEELNQAILDNVLIETGDGDDFVDLYGNGVANINTGAGDDSIFTDGNPGESGVKAVWAFNFDAVRVDDEGPLGNFDPDDLPGEQTSLAYLGGATVTVILSGAGVDGDLSAGGGVMTADLESDDALGANPFQDGYEASAQINDLINGNNFYGDQRDVNAAIMEAINDDPILSQLLTVSMGSNNTLVITSTTSGDFDASDLRIEIERPDRDSWTAVQTEARSVFSDSTIDVSSVSTADAAAGVDLETSDGADAWFDGLSATGDAENSTTATVGELETNLHTAGSASDDEVDTVINGGADDDLIVLSTDADGDTPDNFTVSSNNALLNGASNETIVMTGSDFGDDTVMNFTTAGDPVPTTFETAVFDIRDSVSVVYPVTPGGVTVAIITGIGAASPLEITLSETTVTSEIADEIVAGINAAVGSDFTASATGDVITLTGDDPSASAAGVGFSVQDRDDTGTLATFFEADLGARTNGTTVVDIFTLESGTDFLDFSDYLTSLESPSGSSASETLIDVTLDYGIDADAGTAAANEVIVVRYTNDTTDPDTFDSLSAADIAALYNNTSDYDNGAFVQGNFSAPNDADVVDGEAKAILMVENAGNLGEYKVFELSWNAATTSPTTDVSAVELGSLDFGDSLEGLDEVNLVGSDAYNDLLDNGFGAYAVVV